MRSTSSRYGATAQTLHWLTAMLVLAAYVLSIGDGNSLYSAAADGLRRIHETFGLLAFTVVVVRLLWRLIDSTPAKQPQHNDNEDEHSERLVNPADPVRGGGIERTAIALAQHIGGENQHDGQPMEGLGAGAVARGSAVQT